MTSVGSLLEEGENYKIIRRDGEVNPTFLLLEPKLTQDEEEIINTLQKYAMGEGDINIGRGTFDETREAVSTMLDNLFSRHLPFIEGDEKERYKGIIFRNMFGYGRLQPMVESDVLEEVMVNGSGIPVIVFHRKFGMCETNVIFEDEQELRKLIDRIAFKVKRKIDLTSPLLDARLPDGSRVNATLAPITLDGSTLTIRKFKADPLTIIDLVKSKTMDSKTAAFLWICIDGMGSKPMNILVAGGTGSGKTTTLNCMVDFIPQSTRVITIEDTAELNLKPFHNLVRAETRPPNVEGRGEITMEGLMRNALRMRPDRIIVGEVRGPEAQTLFTAMNTGHDGCMGTLHSNTAEEVVNRLLNPPMDVPKIMLPSLNIIVIEKRLFYKGAHVRKITEIAWVRSVKNISDHEIDTGSITEWDAATDTWNEIKTKGIFRKISEFSGASSEDIIKEMEARQSIIEWMIRTKVKGRQDVRKLVKEYYADKDRFLLTVV